MSTFDMTQNPGSPPTQGRRGYVVSQAIVGDQKNSEAGAKAVYVRTFPGQVSPESLHF